MLKIEDITTLQLDITSLCNAVCVFCCRTSSHVNKDGSVELSVNKNLPLKSMEFDVYKAVFSEFNLFRLKSLKFIEFIPTYGDPLMVPNIIDFVSYINGINNNLDISMHTNGSMRTPEFYANLANTMSQCRSSSLVFSIDGLEDTNHRYRKGVDYKKVMKNAAAFIQAGGNAVWKAVEFEMNQHQMKEMEETSVKMGFSKFWATPNRGGGELTLALQEATYSLKKPEFTPPNRTILGAPFSYQGNNIKCPWHQNKTRVSIFIDMDGRVWPCCFYANSQYLRNAKSEEISKIFNTYESNFNNIMYHSLDEILNNDFFTALSNSNYSSIICNTTCSGKRFS